MSTNQERKAQLEDQLLEQNGFEVPAKDLMEYFVAENMHKKEGQDLSQSLTLLRSAGYAEAIVASLKSHATKGIEGTEADLALRRRVYGANKRHVREGRTVCSMIGEVFEDFILRVLCVAAVVSTTLGVIKDGWAHGFQEGCGIVIAIIIIVGVTVINDYIKEKQFMELMSKGDVLVTKVRRNGQNLPVDSEELVVGDVVEVKEGETVPADCLVLEATSCSCSEAALTGEPEGLTKETANDANISSGPDPFLLQSALVEKGQCLAIVVAVGDKTNQGRAGLSMNIESESTPLQKKLDRIAEGIGKLGLAVAILTFIAIVISALVKVFKDDTLGFDMGFVTDVCNGLVIAITVVVVAVPEGLPLAVTISLAYSVGKMSDAGNLVRKLASSETMGNANEICTDKTGTLTQNKMTVKSAYLEGAVVDGESTNIQSFNSSKLIQECVILNSTAYISKPEEGSTDAEKWNGNATEIGLTKYLKASGVDVEAAMTERLDETLKPIFGIPFSSVRKRATTVIKMGDVYRVFVKGAPDIVIKHCTSMIGENGNVQELNEDGKDHAINVIVENYANNSLRTLLVSYRDYSEEEWSQLGSPTDMSDKNTQASVENELTMVGIFGLKDPLRNGIADAIAKCHRAGINVRMVTGDNLITARAISLEAGIITEADLADGEDADILCMNGSQFAEAVGGKVIQEETLEDCINEDGTAGTKTVTKVVCNIDNMGAFRRIERKLKVMARSQPDDKFLLVDGLIRIGRTVAVTGDGTNDAPALNRSDVGFAMGITGTDVAKSACDIQLMKDDFCDIVTAVKYGRNIYDNVRKFLQFQLTVNVVAMFIVFAGACLFSEPPLTSTQMLWVNLIMDTFAALALATEPPQDSVLLRQPALKTDAIVNAIMWRNVIGQSIFQIIVLLVLLFCGGNIFNIDFEQSDDFYYTAESAKTFCAETFVATTEDPVCLIEEYSATPKVLMYTIVFQTFVFMQLFNQINSRKLGERDFNVFSLFFNNPMFIAITIFTFGVQIAIVQFGDRYMRCVPLSWEQNMICAGIGAFSLIWGLILKFVPARWFEWIRLEESEMTEEEEQSGMLSSLKKSRTMRSASQRESKRDSTRKVQVSAINDDFNSMNSQVSNLDNQQ